VEGNFFEIVVNPVGPEGGEFRFWAAVRGGLNGREGGRHL